MVKSVFSQVHGSVSFTVNITTSLSSIYILTLYSGYFGKNPGIWGRRIIKICANIKLNEVVYIKLQNKSVSVLFYLST